MKHTRRKEIITILCLFGIFIGILANFPYRQFQQDRLNRELIAAIKRNDSRTVPLLLKAGTNPNARDSSTSNMTALQFVFRTFRRMRHVGSVAEDTEPTALLTALDAWWKPEGGSDIPPENTVIVKLLLSEQVDVNCHDADGDTPLIEASIAKRTDIVKLLLDKGADVNPKDTYGYTAFDYVNGENQHPYSKPIMQLLKRAGAKPEE